MGALGHFLEDQGFSTTQISLIRLHTEKIRPPRALWVPFELGRPLGVPHDGAFQKRVLKAALSLLQEKEGPVLADYTEEAPVGDADPILLACPYIPSDDSGEDRVLFRQLHAEIQAFRREWTEKSEHADRSYKGISGMTAEEIASWLGEVMSGEMDMMSDEDGAWAARLRYAVDDLKSFYYQALSLRPGTSHLKGDDIERWFWKNTMAGKVLQQLRQFCLNSEHESLSKKASGRIIPNRFLKELEV